MDDAEKIEVLKNHVMRLIQDLANYRLFVGEYGQGSLSHPHPLDQDEAIINYNMTLVHCEQAIEALRIMGLMSCTRV